MKQILLVDKTRPLPPVEWQGYQKCCVDQIGRGLQRHGAIERAQFAPSDLFEQPAGLDPALDAGAFSVRCTRG